jgi:hypothetical protein
VWPEPRPAAARPADRALVEQRFEDQTLVPLAGL